MKETALALWASIRSTAVAGAKVAWTEERKAFVFMLTLGFLFILLGVFRTEVVYLLAAGLVLLLTFGMCAIFAYQGKPRE